MLNAEPIFIQKPDPWRVQFTDPLVLSVAASEKTMKVTTGCSFLDCPLFIEVPTSWDRERVHMLIAKFRARYT